MALMATTRRIDELTDPLAFAFAEPDQTPWLFERGKTALAGRGEALRLRWPSGAPGAAAQQVSAELAAIETVDEVGLPGCGPVAFGALPFTPGAAGELVVPQVVAGRSEDGTRWVTVVSDGDQPPPSLDAVLGAPSQPDAPTRASAATSGVSSAARWYTSSPLTAAQRSRPQAQHLTIDVPLAPEAWCDLVAQATKDLVPVGAGDPDAFVKVVLAREVSVATDQDIDVRAVLDRLRKTYPGCHIICIDGLIGASPELLVSRSGDTVRSHPMAGTAPRGGDPATDQQMAASLLASHKDREEHQITIDMVQDTLLGWCSYVDYEPQPSVVSVANVQHLASLVEGRLSHPAPSVLDLVAALHPTPAVAGWPRERAVDWIAAHEGLDRRRYAGAAGWVDGGGNGTWAVAVRCAEVEGSQVRVYAGNGIVADSDPETELAETRAKLQAMLSAIIRP